MATRKVFVTVTAHVVVSIKTTEEDQEKIADMALRNVLKDMEGGGYFPWLIAADVCDEPAKKHYGFGEPMAVYRRPADEADRWFDENAPGSVK